jgi:D-serine deaminase-like pyridoxal phosphate-dependent protein
MAMSRDRGTQKQQHDYGYGQVCSLEGALLDGLQLSSANQEHGIISSTTLESKEDISNRLPVGTQLRILPNHACATGAQFPEYHTVVINEGGMPEIRSTWQRFYGW